MSLTVLLPCFTYGVLPIPPCLEELWDGELNQSSASGGENTKSSPTSSLGLAHLAVCVDHGAQELPGATAPVHADHAQDLQEPQTPEGRGGKDVPLGARGQHGDGRDQHHDVCRNTGQGRVREHCQSREWDCHCLGLCVAGGLLCLVSHAGRTKH